MVLPRYQVLPRYYHVSQTYINKKSRNLAGEDTMSLPQAGQSVPFDQLLGFQVILGLSVALLPIGLQKDSYRSQDFMVASSLGLLPNTSLSNLSYAEILFWFLGKNIPSRSYLLFSS